MEQILQAFDIRVPGMKKAGDVCLSAARHLKDHFVPHARNNYHPHVLGDRSLALMSAALVAVKIFSIALLSFGPVVPALSSAITVPNIISLTNSSRSDFNLPALTENQILDKAAQTKADDMLAKGYFSHNTPDNKTPWDFITAAGYSYLMAGENLAVNFTQAENVEDAWMNSPGHKANILNKNFEEIGIGISQGVYQGHSAIFVVQMFGLPAEQKIALTNVPTKVLTTNVPVPTAAPEVRGAVSEPKLSVTDAQTQIQNGQILVSAKVLGDPVKVVAYFGQRAVMLSPKSDATWTGQISTEELAAGNLTVHVKAFDIKGQTSDIQLADFANNTVTNFNVVSEPTAGSTNVSWMGRVFNPKTVEGKFYLFFIAGLLTSMVVAIGMKRHVQHLNLIANSSFVVILACLLFMAG